VKLTWNQRRALENLNKFGDNLAGASSRDIAEGNFGCSPCLCGSAARSALMALERKELVRSFSFNPIRYRITEAGKAALEGGKTIERSER